MKHSLRLFILLAAFSFVTEVFAVGTGLRENPKDRNEKKQVALKDYLKELESKYDVSFGFANEVVEDKSVTLSASSTANMQSQLSEALSPLGLSYKEIDKDFYVIQNNEVGSRLAGVEEEDFADVEGMSADALMKQAEEKVQEPLDDVKVTGKVTSMEDGSPMPGVNVVIKGTSNGTITDIDGNYSITVPEDATLRFTYIGHVPEEIPVNNRTQIDVTMAMDIETLSEVVVVGYGEQERANLTGSVVDIEAEEIEDIPVGNFAQTLQGRMAGVKVGQSTGKPGEPVDIQIRTSSSTDGVIAEQVLYVIDGVIYEEDGPEQFNRLDPSEVKSVSILKDASAAVYGARASGGVVLVKTKRGSVGKPKIDYSVSVGIGNPTQIPKMLSARQHAEMYNEIRSYEFDGPPQNDFERFTDDELEAMDTLNYNWLDDLYKPSRNIRHTLNVSGGTENIRYFFGGSFYNEDGNIDNLTYNRYSLRGNVEADITDNLTFDIGISTNHGEGREPNYGDEENPGVLESTYQRMLTAPKWVPQVIDGKPVYNAGSFNPYALINSDSYKKDFSNNSMIRGGLTYKFPMIEGLKANVNYAFNESSGRGKEFAQAFTLYNFKTTGSNLNLITDELTNNPEQVNTNREGIRQSASHSQFYQLNASLSYKRSFGLHDVEALLVYEQREEESNSFHFRKVNANIRGFDYQWAFPLDGADIGGTDAESGRLAYIGRLNYSYDGKYLIEAAFRSEASNNFDPDNRWGTFPSLSVGWKVSEEGFFQDNVPFIDFMKLRGSAGQLGNEGISPFMWKLSYNPVANGAVFGETITNGIDAKNDGIFTPTITWQTTNFYNAGIDLKFLQNRVNFSTDFYYKYTFDILTTRSNYPINTGINKAPAENYGIGHAKGLEFQAGYTDDITSDISYSVQGNFSWDYSRPLKVIQNPAAYGRWDDKLRNHDSNQPGWIAEGIIRDEETLEHVKSMYDSIAGQPVQMGMIYYKDVRGENWERDPDGDGEIGDGKLDTWDRDIIAEFTSPPYNYGFTLSASWKNIVSVSGTFSGQFGHKVFIQKDEQVLPTKQSNVFAWWDDHWTEDNRDAAYPRPFEYGLMEQNSTFWMRDGNTLRLSNMNISVNMPDTWLENIGKLSNVRFYYSATNLWTIISPYDYKDPAVSEAYHYPLTRMHNFGLNVSL